MANYVEYIKVANGESWPVKDPAIRNELAETLQTAKNYTDTTVAAANMAAYGYSDNNLQTAKNYADDAVESTKEELVGYVDEQTNTSKIATLWTNDSPLTARPAGSITVGALSGYTIFIIECRHSSTYGYANTCTIVGRGQTGAVHFPKATYGGNSIADTYRYFTINSGSDSVTYSNGYSNGAESSTSCIPNRIFGLKL